jgi:hypothetical protein
VIRMLCSCVHVNVGGIFIQNTGVHMSDVNQIRQEAKAAGISGKDLLAAKREIEAYHVQRQEFIDQVRRSAFTAKTGRRDRFWMIFGHESDRLYGQVFHGDGDYTTIHGWDTIASSVWLQNPGLCSQEEDAPEALWNFIRYESFRIPTNADLYREAFKMLVNTREQLA